MMGEILKDHIITVAKLLSIRGWSDFVVKNTEHLFSLYKIYSTGLSAAC